MQDQQISGAIMWIIGSMMFIMIALIVIAFLFQKDKDRPGPISPDWDSEQAMIAPGLEDRVSQNRWRKVAGKAPTDISQPT